MTLSSLKPHKNYNYNRYPIEKLNRLISKTKFDYFQACRSAFRDANFLVTYDATTNPPSTSTISL